MEKELKFCSSLTIQATIEVALDPAGGGGILCREHAF